MSYECEIIECRRLADGDYLCTEHLAMAKERKKYQLVICMNCLRVVKILPRDKSMLSIHMIENCPYCSKEQNNDE